MECRFRQAQYKNDFLQIFENINPYCKIKLIVLYIRRLTKNTSANQPIINHIIHSSLLQCVCELFSIIV
jgi:hypothetical protein